MTATQAVSITNPLVSYGTKTVSFSTGAISQSFTLKFDVTAGAKPIYISKIVGTALNTSNSNSSVTITPIDWSSNNTMGDGSTYFYVAPGQTKTLTATYQASSASSANSTVFQYNFLNFSYTGSAPWSSFSSPSISSALKAVLFH